MSTDELKALAATDGDEIDKSGTITGTMHRGWMSVKAAHDEVRDLRNAHA